MKQMEDVWFNVSKEAILRSNFLNNGLCSVDESTSLLSLLDQMDSNFLGDECLTLNGPWYDFVPVSFCKLLNEPADRMVQKTLEEEFQTILHSIARLFTEF